MRIESVTAHAFGPIVSETLELAPGLTVVAGVNESAKSSWHAALYAGLCGRGDGTVQDRRLTRYEPWDGGAWLVSSVVVLDDGRRLEVCQDLADGPAGRVVERSEDGTGRDVTGEIRTDGAPDASRWLGLDRAAFAAVALVNQAEHRAVRDAADGLAQYLRRATETAGTRSSPGDGSAVPALEALDRFLADEGPGRARTGAAALAQDRVRLVREARVVARRGHEQYLTDLAAVAAARTAVDADATRLRAAEAAVTALEQVSAAARTAAEARAAADRARAGLDTASAACAETARRAARVRALRTAVPRQDSGPGEPALPGADAPPDPAPRTDGDVPTSEGVDAERLRGERATPPADGADPGTADLAGAHRAALAALAAHDAAPAEPDGAPAGPEELRRVADRLAGPAVRSAPPEDDPAVAELAAAVDAAQAAARTAAAAAEAAERDAAAAEEQYERMRATAASATAPRRRSRAAQRLQALALTVVGVGVGLAALYFGLLAALVIGMLVILPVVVSLLAAVVVVVRAMRRRPRTDAEGRPLVEDLVGAIVVVRERKAAAGRAREAAGAAERTAEECRTRHVAALRGERPDPDREHARAWCAGHGLTTEPDALRALADRTAERAARRAVERTRLAAAVARTGDALRAALRECGILDVGSPLDQFARYAASAARTQPERAQPERARAPRAAVALAERPRSTAGAADGRSELAALLAGGSADDLRREEEQLRTARDGQLTRAWKADLEACETRRRRDDLATQAGVDPARAGDAAFLAARLDEARSALVRARAAQAALPAVPAPGETPPVARADEEVDAAEAALRRTEQLRRTTALTRRLLARAQEQTHRDLAPVLAATLRTWLPAVTRGRYTDALVDPDTLAVQVYGRSGGWRPVDRLSTGTADQVYLLLRVALAQHLATTGETCPLLLDGVTAQADGERTTEILDLLLRLGAERQVVLFTHEESVLRWAREHLDGDRHRVRELTRLPAA